MKRLDRAPRVTSPLRQVRFGLLMLSTVAAVFLPSAPSSASAAAPAVAANRVFLPLVARPTQVVTEPTIVCSKTGARLLLPEGFPEPSSLTYFVVWQITRGGPLGFSDRPGLTDLSVGLEPYPGAPSTGPVIVSLFTLYGQTPEQKFTAECKVS
jgi:hypothetical protein